MKLLRLLWLSSLQTPCFQALRLIRMVRIFLPKEGIPSPELMVLSSTRVPSKVLLRLRALVARHQLPLSPHQEATRCLLRKDITCSRLLLCKMLPSPILSFQAIFMDSLQVKHRANMVIRVKQWVLGTFSQVLMQVQVRVVEEEARRKLQRFSSKQLSSECSSA